MLSNRHGCSARTLLEVLRGSVNELESLELEATLLEAADDVANEPTLDTVGLASRDAIVNDCTNANVCNTSSP